jgi:GNAT superfamily N-acetyltransferase
VRELYLGAKFMSLINVTLREDIDPDPDFYYHQQFEIYQEPYLIWDRDTWEAVLTASRVYRIEIDGGYGGDVILKGRGEGIKYIVDFSILPERQGKGVGKVVLEQIKTMAKKLTAVTRKETLHFFLKSGFVLKRTVKNYYQPGVEGYYISFETRTDGERVTRSKGQPSGNQDTD